MVSKTQRRNVSRLRVGNPSVLFLLYDVTVSCDDNDVIDG
jgi:hypothetical protein